ncbi:hypothetical protein D7Z54_28500 [Salibacterium salarium]|uniref:Uncharacterized protein n=1 Tax=Salibacterium salarium TaxID=284579 RepID=A0A428MUY6_9BACI|nr:hypothetical protein [Salibacterium salarium]RSL29963.1 hypothetical protein D7Z54_28500 [Salibacterium salarium]
MFITKLIHKYRSDLGFRRTFIDTVKNFKVIRYLLILSIVPLIGLIYSTFFVNFWVMILSILLYVGIMGHAGNIRNRELLNSTYSPVDPRLKKFRTILYDLNIDSENNDDLEVLENLIREEEIILKESLKLPLSGVITQLITALLVTLLLTYSVSQMIEGSIESAYNNLVVYVSIIGFIFMLSSLIMAISSFSKSNVIREILLLIMRLKLENKIIKNNFNNH